MRLSRSTSLTILLTAALTLGSLATATAQPGDVKGAKDYPGIGRFEGSVIGGYEVKNFDATTVQAAPFVKRKPSDARRIEGRIIRIAYHVNNKASVLEVARNFELQLGKAGFETLLRCDAKACGGTPFSYSLDRLPIPKMWIDAFKYHYFAGHKSKDGRDAYATLVVSESKAKKLVYAQLIIAEVEAMENKMVDAAAMAKGLGEKGHIALYGIYFDTDKAVIKPASKPTLEQIAKLLQDKPKLNVFIVGHTDNQGTFDYNMNLSHKRAAAVAAALAKDYRIAPGRLQTAGVGYLAPVGSNATDAGRALNRRVELVEP